MHMNMYNLYLDVTPGMFLSFQVKERGYTSMVSEMEQCQLLNQGKNRVLALSYGSQIRPLHISIVAHKLFFTHLSKC